MSFDKSISKTADVSEPRPHPPTGERKAIGTYALTLAFAIEMFSLLIMVSACFAALRSSEMSFDIYIYIYVGAANR